MNHDLIYDWNDAGDAPRRPVHRIEFDDETLRDGLQSPSVVSPSLDQKLEIVRLMDAMGIDTADIGLPGAGAAVMADTLAIARTMADEKMRIVPNCAARTLEADIRPIAEIAQKTGRPMAVAMFIGSSPIRRYAEDWTVETIVGLLPGGRLGALTRFLVQHRWWLLVPQRFAFENRRERVGDRGP